MPVRWLRAFGTMLPRLEAEGVLREINAHRLGSGQFRDASAAFDAQRELARLARVARGQVGEPPRVATAADLADMGVRYRQV